MNKIIAQRGTSSFLIEVEENKLYALLDTNQPCLKPAYSTTPDTFLRFGYFTDYEKNIENENKVNAILMKYPYDETL